ncbi:hypothetical protein PsorP6_014714 [Peronosclerospora sorghi]|uniref:Uncharacterized protein n=1 Tax=Peronosclerospora sorghi TaxID=230839 RepID=A0ACC0VS47_9STRA|nr:hypothetical protein PsorP6_014714 [Peronosclerospora sorghi]
MAMKKRKRQSAASDDAASIRSSERLDETNSVTDSHDRQNIDAELSSINDLLQEKETSQKQTWQIGKRVKRLLETYEDLPTDKQLDAYFLWGAALARLASMNEDTILAEAAVDKFRQMQELSKNEADEDAALGPVGFSLWGSSLLILATETQDRQVLNDALIKFQRAVEVDGGTTFETKFQLAKALKEGGDLLTFLDSQNGSQVKKNDYYSKALTICKDIEEIYHVESENQKNVTKNDDVKEEVEDDDKVMVEDFAEAKLLEAVLQGLCEDSSKVEDFNRTMALYQDAMGEGCFKCCTFGIETVVSDIAEAIKEVTNYIATRCLTRANLDVKLTLQEWDKMFDELEQQYKRLLRDANFDLEMCHEICQREDMPLQEERQEEEVDERAPHLLEALGKGLAAFVRSFPYADDDTSQKRNKRTQRNHKAARNTRFAHAVELLRCAHHFHDKLGSYHLACLFASPAFEDEEQCRMWLETAYTYGSLDKEFDVGQFSSMHEKPWFKRLTQPVELA